MTGSKENGAEDREEHPFLAIKELAALRGGHAEVKGEDDEQKNSGDRSNLESVARSVCGVP